MWWCRCGVRGGPGECAGVVVGEGPVGGLLGAVVASAGRADVAFAGGPAVVVGDGVVEVAGGGGAAAARRGAGGVADLDEVTQRVGGLVGV